MKTAKCIDVAELALAGRDRQITVSTVREAEYFFEGGIDDIFYAVGMVPAKVDRLARLQQRGARIRLTVDNVAMARAVSERAEALETCFDVLIEIDCDGHRAGMVPDDPALTTLGQALQDGGGTRLVGVMTHGGESYHCGTTGEIEAMAERERRAVLEAAGSLREAGLPCEVVSVGSTPTARYGQSLEGVTEIRPGVYMFYDLVMAGLGVCAVADIALSVLATVISHRRDKQWIITDAGWTALSRDRGTASQAVDQGYGLVTDLQGRPLDDLIVVSANQEHGIIADRRGGPVDFDRLPVGSCLRILPNHACATASAHTAYRVVDGGEQVLATWQRCAGW